MLALPTTTLASSPVRGFTKAQIVRVIAKTDHLKLSTRQEQDCFRVRSYQDWAATTFARHIPLPLCNVKAYYNGKLEPWQPDVAILHYAVGGWLFVWEFDGATAGEAAKHGIPPHIFRALVNRQLFR